MVTTRRPMRRALPDLFDWVETLPELFTWATLPTVSGVRSFRVEEYVDDGTYVVRAELPGMRPEDISVEVDNGILTIHAERKQEHREHGMTEFQYGEFERRIALPKDGVDESKITARYDAGILEVTVPVTQTQSQPRAIPVQRTEQQSIEGSGTAQQQPSQQQGS
ncbi:HSP20 family molecular chaperone IbpA [Thermasporomyces composti]|mgnify:CR=1 FL=1|uniref:HSP20 family molecular chaperone IbpA n=2 Tax=Thermasporomyces composti TaxID=696763 RepID=A0A3D9V8K6_THECX|nr:HSP20 family molecular chaperone IbpA [Thermasporomyces composti]